MVCDSRDWCDSEPPTPSVPKKRFPASSFSVGPVQAGGRRPKGVAESLSQQSHLSRRWPRGTEAEP